MVGAFGIFATLSTIDMKQLGVGLATTVLLDATIVRGVLLPAAMQLLGENAWNEARWLKRMPSLGHGAPAAAVRSRALRHRRDVKGQTLDVPPAPGVVPIAPLGKGFTTAIVCKYE
jgi:uncharacterized membrane protein YdfJ with MMPL/SSD domain